MTKRVHKSKPHDVFVGTGLNGEHILNTNGIGRPGWLGNPYKESLYGAEKAVELYATDLDNLVDYYPTLKYKLLDMHGKVLGCEKHADELSHADVIVEKIEELYLKYGN